MTTWNPSPGQMALYVGRTKAATRTVRVLAPAAGDRMVVEAIGRKGFNVKLTVKSHNLREPQPDLFGLC